jgi:hypothetical protein
MSQTMKIGKEEEDVFRRCRRLSLFKDRLQVVYGGTTVNRETAQLSRLV